MPKFISRHPWGISVYIPEKPNPIRISGSSSNFYQTTDEDEVRALENHPDVKEVHESQESSSDKGKD